MQHHSRVPADEEPHVRDADEDGDQQDGFVSTNKVQKLECGCDTEASLANVSGPPILQPPAPAPPALSQTRSETCETSVSFADSCPSEEIESSQLGESASAGQSGIHCMGFDPSLVEIALMFTDGDEEQAINAMIDGTAPLSLAQLDSLPHAGDDQSGIRHMGFDPSLVDGALVLTDGDEYAAIDAILVGAAPLSLAQWRHPQAQQLAPAPDVDDMPFYTRKNAILYGSSLPSVINLGDTLKLNGSRVEQPDFCALSKAELLQLSWQLQSHPNNVTVLNVGSVCGGGFEGNCLTEAIMSLKNLQELHLDCKYYRFLFTI